MTKINQIMSTLSSFLKRHHWLLSLILLFVVTRLPYLIDGTIPFLFDHGKDSLAIMHMWLLKQPKFVGPWTSIPGLYFGPAWYYLLLPFYVVGGGHPLSGMIAMWVLHIILIILAYRYFGKLAATIFTTAPTWFTITQSAWNPFPMALVSLLILVILKQLSQSEQPPNNRFFWLALCASFGFHFSTAFAIFYPIIIVGFFITNKIKIRWQQIWLMILGFAIPFLPQALFELKNNFVETKAVINYLLQPEQIETRSMTIWEMMTSVLSELKLSFAPELYLINDNLESHVNLTLLLITAIFLLIGVYFSFTKDEGRKIKSWLWQLLLWVIIPTIGFSFLHFNVWYLLGMSPAIVVIISQIMTNVPAKIRYVFIALLLATAISKVIYYYDFNRQQLMADKRFLPAKLQAFKMIRDKSNGQSFSSYHYEADVYDFPYQYLYFWQARHGQKLPVEFSYQPQTYNYAVQKADLVSYFRQREWQQLPPAEKIFYLVERPAKEEYLQSWWQQQQPHQVLGREYVVPGLELIESQPQSQ